MRECPNCTDTEEASLTEPVVESVDLDAIEARVQAASEGPWIGEYSAATGNCVIPHDATDCRDNVCETHQLRALADAEFIAHAREDVPALVAEVRRLASELAGLRVELERRLTAGNEGFAKVVAALQGERDAARREAEQARAELAGVRVELERTEGDWAVAIREATRARAALAVIREWATANHGGIKTPAEIWPGLAAALSISEPTR